jgi:hypothetical protein
MGAVGNPDTTPENPLPRRGPLEHTHATTNPIRDCPGTFEGVAGISMHGNTVLSKVMLQFVAFVTEQARTGCGDAQQRRAMAGRTSEARQAFSLFGDRFLPPKIIIDVRAPGPRGLAGFFVPSSGYTPYPPAGTPCTPQQVHFGNLHVPGNQVHCRNNSALERTLKQGTKGGKTCEETSGLSSKR